MTSACSNPCSFITFYAQPRFFYTNLSFILWDSSAFLLTVVFSEQKFNPFYPPAEKDLPAPLNTSQSRIYISHLKKNCFGLFYYCTSFPIATVLLRLQDFMLHVTRIMRLSEGRLQTGVFNPLINKTKAFLFVSLRSDRRRKKAPLALLTAWIHGGHCREKTLIFIIRLTLSDTEAEISFALTSRLFLVQTQRWHVFSKENEELFAMWQNTSSFQKFQHHQTSIRLTASKKCPKCQWCPAHALQQQRLPPFSLYWFSWTSGLIQHQWQHLTHRVGSISGMQPAASDQSSSLHPCSLWAASLGIIYISILISLTSSFISLSGLI